MKIILDAIQKAADETGVSRELLTAICTIESSLNPRAIRFEPTYPWLYQTATFAKTLSVSQDTETACQRFSYGLGQVMGAVCREYGFKEHLFELFANQELAVFYAAKHLAKFVKQTKRLEDAVASYNAGSVRKTSTGHYVNQLYVDKVMKEFNLISLSKRDKKKLG